jgi:RimJ/RimL family protein N-acetyltransferase
METTIRQLTRDDLALIPGWASDVRAVQFTSRVCPHAFRENQPQLPPETAVAWFAILVDGAPKGHVWLERDESQADTVVLGILIGDSRLLGRGIGRRAIELAIEAASKRLAFSRVRLKVRKSNPRAIACYERCGFRIADEGVKEPDDGPPIEFFVMERGAAMVRPGPHRRAKA